MDLDPTLRGGLEMGLKICPMKTSTDTSKAFDSVENGRLLDKLGWYGIDHRRFAAWLKERSTDCVWCYWCFGRDPWNSSGIDFRASLVHRLYLRSATARTKLQTCIVC